ncbi:uncharacterized protein EDB91DRAFT_280448 [Suillus paluster]|uniref:uncharacterized protein n=1 Tax=Suillus paluster TaxID=48578 RepID=UPI001B883303|nr:uncharacterized protein EDB91DRAFT_280448 [Suillus paluster]KAG1755215.1 hypothetical protein EDB91DRAFT_280448 [Suillus paluster]
MYPISQPGEFDSQPLTYPHDASFHLPPSSDYINIGIARRQSADTYGIAQDTSITLNYSYPPVSYDYPEIQTQVHLHAPVPVPASYGPPHLENSSRQHTPPYLEQPYYEGTNNHHVPYPPSLNQALQLPTGASTTNTNILDYYANAPQLLFPTPSELLTDLSTASTPISTALSSSLPSAQREQSQSSEHSDEAPASAAPTTSKTESQRKARQRAVAEEIGFIPTDPDTISSHEKKRHYLECLEHYVLYLHEQLRLVDTAPLSLERVSTYRGLSSRSIRTLLVHMQNTNRRLHENTLDEEQVFLDLSTEVMVAHGAGFPIRRHSVDIIDQTTSSYQSGSANIGATRDGDRVFLGSGMASSGVDQRHLVSE